MKKYYAMRLTSDPKIKGRGGHSQVKIPNKGNNKLIFDFFNSEEYWTRAEKEPQFHIELENIDAYKTAKMTSFLSFEPILMDCHFLVDDNVKQFFQQFNIQQHWFYKANVTHRDKTYNYWLFYMPPLGYEVIDFKNSVFYSGGVIVEKREYFVVNNQQDLLKQYNENNIFLNVEKLSLNEHFDHSLDFFETKKGGIYVSERFRHAVLDAGFSNINFIPAFDGDLHHVQVKVVN